VGGGGGGGGGGGRGGGTGRQRKTSGGVGRVGRGASGRQRGCGMWEARCGAGTRDVGADATRCAGSASEVSRKRLGSASEVSRRCLGSFSPHRPGRPAAAGRRWRWRQSSAARRNAGLRGSGAGGARRLRRCAYSRLLTASRRHACCVWCTDSDGSRLRVIDLHERRRCACCAPCARACSASRPGPTARRAAPSPSA